MGTGEVTGGTEPFDLRDVVAAQRNVAPEPKKWSEGADIPPGSEDYPPEQAPQQADVQEERRIASINQSVADDIWALLREWFGNQGPIDELGLMEQRAAITGQHPLEVLRHTIRLVVDQGLWG